MDVKWRRRTVATRTGNLLLRSYSDYLCSQNINQGAVGLQGRLGGWWYEVVRLIDDVEVFVGQSHSLKEARRVAELDFIRRAVGSAAMEVM